jgi:hypothetical protein
MDKRDQNGLSPFSYSLHPSELLFFRLSGVLSNFCLKRFRLESRIGTDVTDYTDMPWGGQSRHLHGNSSV